MIGHNWGFLAGIHVLQSYPNWFDSLVILNTNSLPDGEVDPSRFSSPFSLLKYLKYDAYFLAFHSAMGLLKAAFPLSLLYSAMNFRYSQKDKRDFMAPFQVIYVFHYLLPILLFIASKVLLIHLEYYILREALFYPKAPFKVKRRVPPLLLNFE